MVVLDAIHQIQATQAGDLAVRWNCRGGQVRGRARPRSTATRGLMCMTRLNTLNLFEPISVEPMRAFPPIKDLVTDVSWNYRVKQGHRAVTPRQADAPDGTWRMQQAGCRSSAGVPQVHRVLPVPGRLPRAARPPQARRVHRPALPRLRRGARDAPARRADRCRRCKDAARHRLLQHHQVLHEGLPEHITITDNAIIPLKERVVDRFYDPLTKLLRVITG
jgi:succinate dehydrogenase / fumarate reductase iron-sulfur subunit